MPSQTSMANGSGIPRQITCRHREHRTREHHDEFKLFVSVRKKMEADSVDPNFAPKIGTMNSDFKK